MENASNAEEQIEEVSQTFQNKSVVIDTYSTYSA